MKVVLLAGGFGTRLAELTDTVPKPMVEIGGKPLLWHIMKIYAAYGHREFMVALGFKGEIIKDYFLSSQQKSSGKIQYLHNEKSGRNEDIPKDWAIQLVDTGLQTGTGGRLRCMAELVGNATFFMTYGDGVADVDVRDLLKFHKANGKLATVTAVRPPARFGLLNIDGDLVTKFVEKPSVGEGWINGGFFVLEPGVIDYIESEEVMFERDPLAQLAEDGELAAYRHHGFWQPMDTLRDVRFLKKLWLEDAPPWKVWDS